MHALALHHLLLPVSASLLASTGAAIAASPVTPARPKILLILADDLGFSDLGCYGSDIQTPNLDRMAKNDLRFTQFYNTAYCRSTRASLLTGYYSPADQHRSTEQPRFDVDMHPVPSALPPRLPQLPHRQVARPSSSQAHRQPTMRPGFPRDGTWVMRSKGLKPMQ